MKLDPVGLDNHEEPAEPIDVPLAGHPVDGGEPVVESFRFRGRLNLGAGLELIRSMRQNDGITVAAAIDYIEAALLPAELEPFRVFLARPDIEIPAKTLWDLQQALAEQYNAPRPTRPSRPSSNGRSTAKRTSAGGSRERASGTSTRSRSR